MACKVRLPIGFRFEGDEVYVRRDPTSGDVIISRKPRPTESWAEFFELRNDTASYIIKGTRPSVDRRVLELSEDEVCLSVVTRAELLYGVQRRGQHERSRLARVVEAFLGRVRSLAWDDGAGAQFAVVANHLEQSGRAIGTVDTMIAAHALATGCVVVTNNVAHFSRVPGLSLQNWAADT